MKLVATITAGLDEAGFLRLSIMGGLVQFGAYVDTLAPGAVSSERHWHDREDEALFMLEGVATLEDDTGLGDIGPGDAVCWPYGVANGHHLVNRTDRPCSFLMVGSRVAGDRCTYPDSGSVQVNGTATWQAIAADGQVLRGGDLPPELLNLPQVWGDRGAGPFVSVQRAAERVWVAEVETLHRVLGGGLGPYRHCVLGDAGGISQFGLHLEALPPGSRSSFRHWHAGEDEMVVMLSGEVVLIEDAESTLRAGDAVCWPAGVPVGHCLENRGVQEAVYLVIGTRHQRDVIHYPDHDLIVHKGGTSRAWFHADGRVRKD